ncbi:MAG TPA: TolC family protein [Bacteroidetes bacterium]|nr:TolC family protein [Bacteroidota bacterium]
MENQRSKYMYRLFAGLCSFLIVLSAGAADSTAVMKLSLDEAVQVAGENNRNLINARYDVRIARRSYLETLANGLPQVTGSAALNDNLKLMTQLIPAEIFGGTPGEYIPVQFGTKYNANYGFNATQLIFSAPYLVGLQTTRLMEELSKQGLEQTEREVKKSVMSNYFLILVSEKSLEIIHENRENLLETLRQTRKLQQVGMREETDVDKIDVSVSMLDNTVRSTELNIQLNYNLLRFQLGLDPETEITLTSTLDETLTRYLASSLQEKEFIPENHIDYQIMKTQVEMAKKNLLMEKASFLPTLSGFYSYTRQGMGNEIAIERWFPSSIIGLQMNVPLFSSGGRYQKVKQAKIELEKAANTRDMMGEQLSITERQYRNNLHTALEKYENQQKNVEVSERVLESTRRKFEQGMASVFDMVQANNDYLQSESELLNAILEVLNASLELEMLLTN